MNGLVRTVLACLLLAAASLAQQKNPPVPEVEKTSPTEKMQQPPTPETPRPEPRREREEERHPPAAEAGRAQPAHNYHWDMKETPPVVSHHVLRAAGKELRYTATAGRMPIKDPGGEIDAEMFYVAYTLDGADFNRRPVTFAFNGGPGSASIWLHMGALGPRKVVLQQEGFMPEAPYRLMDNASTPLDATDLVLVDAIGTGFSRPADMEKGKKFWGVKGDIQSFGEFIRMYITRNQRWTSPLYLLGESYGTTRSAGIAGYLSERGISFNGIILLSMVLNFESLEFAKTNDLPYELTLPTYTMIAAYHKRLASDLMQDLGKTRQEVEHWASTEYAGALAQGDALTSQERQKIIDQFARYTGLRKDIIDQANLRIDVQTFTHYLLGDEKLRVGRLDGRYTGPDPQGFLETQYYDPTGAATGPPFTSVFNEYVRRELKYETDLPYYVSAGQIASSEREGFQFWRTWEWGSAVEGFPDTASQLRAAMVKNPYLKVLVMEGYYDLATPFWAADYTMNHLDLSPQYRKNISYATYDAGHMVYLRNQDLQKMHKDVDAFINATMPKGQ